MRGKQIITVNIISVTSFIIGDVMQPVAVVPGLTGREKEIAQLAAGGLTNREIGERLYISPNTVKTQLKSIFEKLDVNWRTLLRQYWK
jgi:DNA-binding CsgD family transcriptional regulator